jgi:hypothetical protein
MVATPAVIRQENCMMNSTATMATKDSQRWEVFCWLLSNTSASIVKRSFLAEGLSATSDLFEPYSTLFIVQRANVTQQEIILPKNRGRSSNAAAPLFLSFAS